MEGQVESSHVAPSQPVSQWHAASRQIPWPEQPSSHPPDGAVSTSAGWEDDQCQSDGKGKATSDTLRAPSILSGLPHPKEPEKEGLQYVCYHGHGMTATTGVTRCSGVNLRISGAGRRRWVVAAHCPDLRAYSDGLQHPSPGG